MVVLFLTCINLIDNSNPKKFLLTSLIMVRLIEKDRIEILIMYRFGDKFRTQPKFHQFLNLSTV